MALNQQINTAQSIFKVTSSILKFPIFVIFISIFIFPILTKAQVSSDTVSGSIGIELCLPVKISFFNDSINSIKLKSTFILSNPSIFYPEKINLYGEIKLINSNFKRFNDSLYSFEIEAEIPFNLKDVTLFICGETLAGYDSICNVDFNQVELNDGIMEPFRGRIYIESSFNTIPYVRFAKLDDNYPNPVLAGTPTIWTYHIDKASEIEFSLFDNLGKESFMIDLGWLNPGTYTYTYIPDYYLSAGAYWFKLKTNSGHDSRKLIIIK